MSGRALFAFAVVAAAAIALFGGTLSARADITCTSTVGGRSTVTNVKGNVIVPAGASCILNFVNVTGNVKAGPRSTLLITAYTEPSTIGGNVQAEQCASALLEGNVTVGGNVQIQSCIGAGPNGFQGPDIVINGNFLCQGNSANAAACLAWLGRVHGNMLIQSNISATPSDVSLVSVGGNLECDHNSPVVMAHAHGPSWVDGKSGGQCAGFATITTAIDPPLILGRLFRRRSAGHAYVAVLPVFL